MSENSLVQEVDIKKVLPDENQPRKYFAADKMYALQQSVKKHGIKVPLTVEEIISPEGEKTGKYLLIDGERRFRSAMVLGLKTVPCVVESPKSEAERLVEQFSIQEMHESWTPIEKAMALLNLAKIVSKTLPEVCKMLDIPTHIAGRYIAFAELGDKESFIKNEVPLDYAVYLRGLKSTVRSLSEKELKEEFSRSDEKKLEHQLTKMIVRGDVTKRSDIVRLGDSFKKNPKLIEKFMTREGVTPAGLFLEAKAQGAYHLRNAYQMARLLSIHIDAYMKIKDVKIDIPQLEVFHRAQTKLADIISVAE